MTAAKALRYITDVINSLGDEYTDYEVQFMGGEPLLEFETIKEIAEWLWTNPFDLRLNNLFAVTNGTLLTAEMKAWFDNNRERITLGLSFDGTDAMQNGNRSGSFSQVDLQYFASRWPGQAVKMTVSPFSIGNFAKGVEFLHNRGFQNIVVDLACGKKIGWSHNHLTILREQLDKLSDFYVKNRELVPCSTLRVDIFNITPRGNSDPQKNCSCGESLTCIDTDGKHYACHLFSPVACDSDVVERGKAIDFSDHSLFIDEACQQCSLSQLCPHCYGMNFSNTGDVRTQDWFVCQSFKVIYLANCLHQYHLASADGMEDLSNKIMDLVYNQNF